jgi:hypothetical protein
LEVVFAGFVAGFDRLAGIKGKSVSVPMWVNAMWLLRIWAGNPRMPKLVL